MSIAYVPLPISTKEFLEGRNPTSQPGVKLPHFASEFTAEHQATIWTQPHDGMVVMCTAQVGMSDNDVLNQNKTLNLSDIHSVRMLISEAGAIPNSRNAITFFTKGYDSLQSLWNDARQIAQNVHNGMSIKDAHEAALYNSQTLDYTDTQEHDVAEPEEEI